MPIQIINNVRFNYELLGDSNNNPPLVLIPGYACDINFWRPLAEIMANDHQVLIFDNQGIGKTQDDGKALNIEKMATNIKLLIDKLHLKNPIITGFAMGGVIAQKIALDFPEDVSQLILLNSVMKFSDDAKVICEQLCILREKNKLAEYADLIYDTVFGATFKKTLSKENFRESFMPILKVAQTSEGQRRQVEALKTCNSTAWAKDIQVPTLVIASREDRFATLEESRALAKAIASNGTKVDYVVIENSGHSTLVEQLALISELLQQKCTKHSSLQKNI